MRVEDLMYKSIVLALVVLLSNQVFDNTSNWLNNQSEAVELLNCPIVLDNVAIQNVACGQNDNGFIHLEISGGTPPYNYEWSPTGPNSPNNDNLSEGDYSLTITDAEDCSLTQTFTVGNSPASVFNLIIDNISANTFDVCQPDTLFLNYIHLSCDEINGVVINLDLPTGFEYVSSSVGTITNGDLSNPSIDVPTTTNYGDDINWYAIIQPACEAKTALDNDEAFLVNVDLIPNIPSADTTSTEMNLTVQTALLLIQEISPQDTVLNIGDVIERTIKITNSRLGSVSEFWFTDTYSGGIVIEDIQPSTSIETFPDSIVVLLTGADFSSIGNGDAFFDVDECLFLTQTIRAEDCQRAPSDLSVAWGCGGEICDITTASAEIILPEDDINIITTPIINYNECYCNEESSLQQLIVANTGTDDALNVLLNIISGSNSATVTNSISVCDILGNPITDFSLTLGDEINTISSCVGVNDLLEDYEIAFPTLAAGDSLIIKWEMFYCFPECVDSSYPPMWLHEGNYNRVCPEDEVPIPLVEAVQNILEDTLYAATPTVNNGDTATIVYELNSNLLDDEGQLTIELDIIDGFAWDNDAQDFDLGGVSPSINAGTETIVLNYDLPLEDLADGEYTMVFNLLASCTDTADSIVIVADTVMIGGNPVAILDTVAVEEECGDGYLFLSEEKHYLTATSYITLSEDCDDTCSRGLCVSSTALLNVVCGELAIPIQGVGTGYVFWRDNVGLGDNDNNGIPDGAINEDLIFRERLVTGDTLVEKLGIILNFPGTFTSTQDIRLLTHIDNKFNIHGDTFIVNPIGIVPISSSVTISDANTNADYTFAPVQSYNFINNTVQDTLTYIHDISVNQIPSLASSFEYEEGDTIYMENYYKLEQGRYYADGSVDTIRVKPGVEYDFGDLTVENRCINATLNLLVTGFSFKRKLINENSICDSSSVELALGHLIGGPNNFFPFEYRNFGFWDMANMNIPLTMQTASDMATVDLTTTNANNNPNNIHSTFTVPVVGTNELDIDISSILDDPNFSYFPDEEYYAVVTINNVTTLCNAENEYLDSLFAIGEFDFTANFPSNVFEGIATTTDDTNFTVNISKPTNVEHPNLNLNVLTPSGINMLDTICWEFKIKNNTDFDAPNAWLHVSDPANILNIDLFDNAGNSLPDSSGVFQLGLITAGDAYNLTLCGINDNCQEGELEVLYAWGCEPYTNPELTFPCAVDTANLTVNPALPTLEVFVDNPPSSFNVCDTIGEYILHVYNANFGQAFNPICQVDLPDGAIPINSAIAYPDTVGATFVPIADPILNTITGEYEWDVSAFINILPSFNEQPNNQFAIRFDLETNCDISDNTELMFSASGQNICGGPTNSITIFSNPIDIDGIESPYNLSVDLSSNTDFVCEDTASIAINMLHSSLVPVGFNDSLLVDLPVGVTYVPNSITGGDFGEPTIIMVGEHYQLQWQLPEGVFGAAINLEFLTIGYNLLPCGMYTTEVSAVSSASAICSLDGEACTINTIIDAAVHEFSIERPTLEIIDFAAEVSPTDDTVIDYTLTISNSDLPIPLGSAVVFDFYFDTDNNNVFSQGDTLIETDGFFVPLDVNETVSINGSITLNFTSNTCNIIAVLDLASQCICNSDEAISSLPLMLENASTESVCSDELFTIGYDEAPSNVYVWNSTTNSPIPDPNSAMIDLALTNNNPSNEEHIYDLTIYTINGMDTLCTIHHIYTITVYPELISSTFLSDYNGYQVSCISAADGTANVVVDVGTGPYTYEWSTGDTLALVENIGAGTYTVSITDANGCTGINSVNLTEPQALISAMTQDSVSCFGGDDGTASITIEGGITPYEYLWENGSVTSFTSSLGGGWHPVTVTDANGCFLVDSVEVLQPNQLNVIIEQTEISCVGEDDAEVTLIVNGGKEPYISYQWEDALGNEIGNEPVVTGLGLGNYFVTVTDANGCMEIADITVNEPVPLLIELTKTPPACYGGADGIIEANVMNGVPPFLYNIDDSEYQEANQFQNLEAGLYEVCVTDANGCETCEEIYMDQPQQIPLDAYILEGDTTITLGESVEIEVLAPSTIVTFDWNPNTTLDPPNGSSPTATPLETTTYTVIVTDGEGCTESDNITIYVEEKKGVYIPNAFTPDANGNNDVFIIHGDASVKSIQTLLIYNRWGDLVFETHDIPPNDPAFGWNGTFRGKPMNPAVFVYYTDVEFVDGEVRSFKGDVTLIR